MGYVNPVSRIAGLVPERIDMGVDYAGSGPLVALGNAKVFLAADGPQTGWPGGGFVGFTLLDGPYAGKHVYYAENVTPQVSSGQTVTAGQPLGILHDAFPNCELGWSAGSFTEPLARALNQQAPGDPGGWISAAGASFASLMVSLGAPKAPNWGGQVHGTMPPGYPPIWKPAPVAEPFPLREGATGKHVRGAQLSLDYRGYGVTADGDFGPHTAAAVKRWQHDVKRAKTGEIARADWDFMFPQLRLGGNKWPGATIALQKALVHRGHKLALDKQHLGHFGPGVERAVKRFQAANGLTADGVVGPQTWAKLF